MPLQCPHCQSTIALEGKPPREVVCPSCGSSIQLDPDATSGWLPEEAPKRLGKFEFLEQLGVGSFGTVYKARDTELDRLVAVKIPRSGSVPKAEDMDRFLREAKSAAQLKHPGIVSLYDAGTIDGTCCLVSEFISGSTLAERLSAKRFTFRQAAELIAEVADALQYAHQHGVVHRDVKSSNIMLDLEGRPHLMDFGLAKRAADEITMTLEGQVLGTPAYMAPEQARGEARKVDARSDLYSLGVILYELLTGELPFRGQTRMLLVQVIQDEPRPPRRLNDQIPRDLETICLKAMAKEPARRYATARDLADDLRRFLKGEPIQARPVGRWERVWVWVKRRPAAAALLVVSGLTALMLVGGAVGLWYHGQLQEEFGKTQEAKKQAETALEQARQAQKQEAIYKYYHHIALAHVGWRDGDLVQMGPLLDECPRERRHWEWHYLERLRHGDLLTVSLHPSMVICVAFSPDGTQLAVSGTNGMVKILDAATGREILSLNGHGDSVEVWSVAFSPDGKRLASAGSDREIRVWDLASGKGLFVLRGHGDLVNSVAFSHDDTRLVSASFDLTVRVWEAATGREIHKLKGHTIYVHGAAISPDGARVASAGGDKTVKVWDLATGLEVHTLRGDGADVRQVVFSPDRSRLASAGGDRTIIVWDPRTGQRLRTLTGHTGPVRCVAFSPEGSRLASAGNDQTVRLWDLATGREMLTLKGHSSEVLSVAFSPDGTRLASGSPDGTVKTWDTMIGPGAHTLRGHAEGLVESVAYSPDGKWIASASHDRTVKLWDVVTGQEARTLRGHEDHAVGVAFSPDGKLLASTSGDRTVKLWETATGREVHTLKGHGNIVVGVAFSPDGKRLASGSWDRTVRLWDVATGQELHTLQGHGDRVRGVAFSPDGKRLASAGGDATARVWDVATGKELLKLRGHESVVWGVAYSPDGAWLATAAEDNTIRIWDAATGEKLHKLDGHSSSIGGVGFSPDGRRLASVGADDTSRIWDTSTWREAITLRGHGGMMGVAFSPDGTQLISATSDGPVKVWDARPLTPEAAVEREALGLLEFLFARPLRKADVLDYLRTSKLIRPQAQQLALSFVHHYREESDPKKYHAAAWPMLRHLHANVFMCRFALVQMKAACERAPENAAYRIALGVAEYRLGKFSKERYKDALATLSKCDQNHPTALAFLAMTQHQLGQKDQARTTLGRLRDIMKEPQWATNAEAEALLREAAELIEGRGPQPKP